MCRPCVPLLAFCPAPPFFPHLLSTPRRRVLAVTQNRRISPTATSVIPPASVPSTASSPSTTPPRSTRPAAAAKIVCVGDIHGQWNADDERILHDMRPDLVLFVGDYGNEDVNVTNRIAAFADQAVFDVATVFGNHDAFYTASANGRARAPYDNTRICRVSEQMKALASYDVSYRTATFERLGLSVCGGRAFSWGGPNWKHNAFFRKFLGVNGLRHSTEKLTAAVTAAHYSTMIFLSHSGPLGLGALPNDPCGKDWGTHPGGDYGDRDLREAIEQARQVGIKVPLTVFGHMHKSLQGECGQRVMVKTEPDGEDGSYTVMVNAAVVPRHRVLRNSVAKVHHFQMVYLQEGGTVASVEETWLQPNGVVDEVVVLYEAAERPTTPMTTTTTTTVAAATAATAAQ